MHTTIFLDDSELAARGGIPDADRPVVARGKDEAAVGRISDDADSPLVSFGTGQPLATRAGFKESEHPSLIGDDHLPVRRKGKTSSLAPP